MKLQNGYKLVYEKVVGGAKHLFATKEAIPAEEDQQVEYQGLTEQQVKEFKLIYQGEGKFKGAATRIPGADDQEFILNVGAEAVVAGDGVEPATEEAETVTTQAAEQEQVEPEQVEPEQETEPTTQEEEE